MKCIYLIIGLLLFICESYGQDTTYLDSNNKVVKTLSECTHYIVELKGSTDPKLFIYKGFYKSGKIESTATMWEWNIQTSISNGYEGEYREWYESGQLHKMLNFKKGKRDGDLVCYWENGSLKRKEFYQNDTLISSQCFLQNGAKASYYPYLKRHEFPGGRDSLISFVARKASYFQNIDSVKPNFDYYFFFVINKSGVAMNLTMPYNYNKKIYDAALRLIRSMPKWRPALIDGIRENSAMRIAYIFYPNKAFALKFFYNEQDGIQSFQQFYSNAKLFSRTEFLYRADDIAQIGSYKKWNNNGKVMTNVRYNNGKLDGEVISYWTEGQLKRKEIYKEDHLITGQCYDPWGNPSAHGPFSKKAEYRAGKQALDSIIKNKLIYPVEARKNNITGTVYVQFIVNSSGSISGITVKKKVTPILDEEAIRVVRCLGKWKPAIWDGEFVDSYVTLPIEFKQ